MTVATKSTAKKTAAKKPVARKTSARKPIAGRKPRAAREFTPMSSEVREFGAAVLGIATDRAMASETLGVTKTTAKDLTGRRAGMSCIILLDDGKRIAVTVVQTVRAPRKPRVARAKKVGTKTAGRKKVAAEETDSE